MCVGAHHEDNSRPSTPPIQLDYRERAPRHKPISFVTADSTEAVRTSKAPIGDSYLSLVLSAAASQSTSESETQTTRELITKCEICNLPLSTTTQLKQHHTSTAHQACLQHTHVPSSVNRSRKGLQYLQAYGWDPDARTGLGAAGSGRGLLHPIKQKEKIGKGGIGALPRTRKEEQEKLTKMGPKEIKKAAGGQKKRNEQLQRMFYSNGDLEKYLGPDA